MRIGQLIEYTKGNILSKTRTQNVMDKLVPDPYLKSQNWAYLRIKSRKLYTVLSYVQI